MNELQKYIIIYPEGIFVCIIKLTISRKKQLLSDKSYKLIHRVNKTLLQPSGHFDKLCAEVHKPWKEMTKLFNPKNNVLQLN